MASDRSVRQFNVYLSVDTIREVKHHAVETERSLSAITEAALVEYLRRHRRRRQHEGSDHGD